MQTTDSSHALATFTSAMMDAGFGDEAIRDAVELCERIGRLACVEARFDGLDAMTEERLSEIMEGEIERRQHMADAFIKASPEERGRLMGLSFDMVMREIGESA